MKTKTTPSLIEALRMLREDRRRRASREPRRVVVRPTEYDRAENDPRPFDRDTVVFVACSALAIFVFLASVAGWM